MLGLLLVLVLVRGVACGSTWTGGREAVKKRSTDQFEFRKKQRGSQREHRKERGKRYSTHATTHQFQIGMRDLHSPRSRLLSLLSHVRPLSSPGSAFLPRLIRPLRTFPLFSALTLSTLFLFPPFFLPFFLPALPLLSPDPHRPGPGPCPLPSRPLPRFLHPSFSPSRPFLCAPRLDLGSVRRGAERRFKVSLCGAQRGGVCRLREGRGNWAERRDGWSGRGCGRGRAGSGEVERQEAGVGV